MSSMLGTPKFGVDEVETIKLTDADFNDDKINVSFSLKMLNSEKTKYNYSEDKIIEELKRYIDKTYGAHYASKDIQTIDVWQSLGIEKQSCQSNVLKYAMRYGKKGGHNKDDLLKILHYTILWWHFTQPKE